MLYTDDDDATLKTPVVRPNDILGVEVSPVTSSSSSCWQYSFDGTENPQGTPIKSKFKSKKQTGDHSSNGSLRAQTGSPMKRGDPFLPSVFPDENPIADYNVKKNSRKKPSDCKCKGFGYNLSPSALLPEEMRQQWGVGMFGKPTLSRSSATSNTACCGVRENNEPKCTQPNVIRNGDGCANSNCCVLRCKNCMRDPCLCTDIYTKHDGFRIPEANVTRKQKSSTKGTTPRGKENKNLGSLLLGSTNSASVLKRVTFCNSKDNNNIISTSNFHRNSASSLSLNGHSSCAAEMNGYKGGLAGYQISSGVPRQNVGGNLNCSAKKFNYTAHEDFATTPRVRHRHLPAQHQRHMTNIPSPPILAPTGLRVPSGVLETKSSMSRGASQMLMLGNQGCACDSCRQRASLMSKMEELGFPASHAQQMIPPFMLEASQGYQSTTLRSALSTSRRYAPYNVPAYGYAHASNSVYCSPERYQCSSPSLYEYNESPRLKSQTLTSTPLSIAHEMNKIDTSYLDSENSLASPPFSGFGEDITDLSIKDTVDFFVSMKSPFVKFSSATSPETCTGCGSSMSSEEQCASPSYNNGSNTWFCTTGMCASSFSLSPVRQENIYRDSAHHKFDVSEGQTQPMSLLYSSLVSDLEDELRCAIENIPTS